MQRVSDEDRAPARRRRALTLLDQALSSGTNFAGAALVAGLLTATDFGAFAVATSILVIVVGVGRSASGAMLMIFGPGVDEHEFRGMASGAAAAALLVALGGSAVLVLLGWITGGPTQVALWSLSPMLPIILLQDSYRFVALARRDPAVASLSDGAWLVGLLVTVGALRLADVDSLAAAVLATHGSAVLGLLVLPAARRPLPRADALRNWLPSRLGSAARLLGDFLLALSYGVIPLVIVTAINADLAQAGSLRVAQAILGPLTVVYAASTIHLQPTMIRALPDTAFVLRLSRRQSRLNTAVALVWLSLALLIPDGLGSRVFGASWSGSTSAVFFVGVAMVGLAISTGPLTAMRSIDRLTENFLSQLATATIVLVAAGAGGLLFDDGILKGFAVGNLVGAAAPWLVLHRIQSRAHERTSGRS